MRTLLAVSPHLDDAAFSAGALLWTAAQRGWRVVVATVFTGNVAQPSGFALACQLDKGLPADVDYMALRREEDRQACRALGAEPIHLPLLEAPHRGYENAAALFGDVLPHDAALAAVPRALTQVLADLQPSRVLAPLGIGGHVDHLIVRDAIRLLPLPRLRLWEDWPYLDRAGAQGRDTACRWTVSPEARAVKYCVCASYVTQLGLQFGGAGALAERLERQASEWYHPASS
ncbi:PIG-L family deacetylase [uncultured Sphingomonas sp.]|uniref:PIG-L deacetylase family protein n=1 Tax=uncultured Sphingomonas sp. TaxID=158754 RepID=UPI0025F27C12|nr:PIG-L family deacetylase [uncultured Sphingomonas sp.]